MSNALQHTIPGYMQQNNFKFLQAGYLQYDAQKTAMFQITFIFQISFELIYRL